MNKFQNIHSEENEQSQNYLRKLCQHYNKEKVCIVLTLVVVLVLSLKLNLSTHQQIIISQGSTRKITAIFLTCCQRHDMLPLTLSSFFKYNQFPIEKTIVVSDGGINSELAQVLDKYDNISLITTGKKVGQLRALDEALLLVETQYVYISQDDWQTLQAGLIAENINSLQQEPLLIQLWNRDHWGHGKKLKILQNRIVDPNQRWGGFSLNPCVLRMSDIAKLEGGKFWKATNDISYGLGAGNAENSILLFFKKNGYYVKRSKLQYINHLGQNLGNPRKE